MPIEHRIAKPLGLSTVEAAYGITHLADMNMTYGIRNITIERGYDPRDFVLLAFGGAGGLSAAVWASELEIPTVVIPNAPANFSAWGLLNTDFREDRARTMVGDLDILSGEAILATFSALDEACLETLVARNVSVAGVPFHSPSRYALQRTRALGESSGVVTAARRGRSRPCATAKSI